MGIDPITSAQYAYEHDIPIYAIGVGDPEGGIYPVTQHGITQYATIRLDEDRLVKMADIT